MTSTTRHSPAPWSYDYSPYTLRVPGNDDTDPVGAEIPAFEVCDAEGNKVFDTNEDTPCELQEANARLASAAPAMLEALLLAQRARKHRSPVPCWRYRQLQDRGPGGRGHQGNEHTGAAMTSRRIDRSSGAVSFRLDASPNVALTHGTSEPTAGAGKAAKAAFRTRKPSAFRLTGVLRRLRPGLRWVLMACRKAPLLGPEPEKWRPT